MKSAAKLMMPRPDPPCIDCKDRVVGCHGTCEKYKAFKEERYKLWNQIRDCQAKEKSVEHFLIAGAMKSSGKKMPER